MFRNDVMVGSKDTYIEKVLAKKKGKIYFKYRLYMIMFVRFLTAKHLVFITSIQQTLPSN